MGKDKQTSDWYKSQPKKTLQEVFAEHFERNDLEGAKRWMRKWQQADGQIVLGHEDDIGYTVRAMAGHVSDYLEGYTGDEPQSYNGSVGLYLDTKYGSELYNAAFS